MSIQASQRGSEQVGASFPLLEADSIGHEANIRLGTGGVVGKVHSSFRQAVNILTPGGIVSVVSGPASRGPLNVSLAPHRMAELQSYRIEAGDAVARRGNVMVIGNGKLSISLKNARVCLPPNLDGFRLARTDQILENLRVAKKFTKSYGRLQGLGELIDLVDGTSVEDHYHTNRFCAYALPRVRSLMKAVSAGGVVAVQEASGELLGLGLGLTPSADDMLSGMMLILNMYARIVPTRLQFVSSVSRAIASETKARTTLLSREYVEQASQGNGNELLMELCQALLTGGLTDVDRMVRDVLNIGETSGTDTVLGVLLGLQLILRMEGARWKPESQ